MDAEQVITAAMPKWSNQRWLARRVLAALNAAGYRVTSADSNHD